MIRDIFYRIYNTFLDKIRPHCKWSTSRANRIITNAIFRYGIFEGNKIYYTFNMWSYYWADKYISKLRDRAFCGKFNSELTSYFYKEYQLEGYTKQVKFDGEWYRFVFTNPP